MELGPHICVGRPRRHERRHLRAEPVRPREPVQPVQAGLLRDLPPPRAVQLLRGHRGLAGAYARAGWASAAHPRPAVPVAQGPLPRRFLRKVSQFAPKSVRTRQQPGILTENGAGLRMAMRDGTAERREQLYREAIDLISRDYARDLQLEGVAKELATSRRQLQRAFAEIGNTSFRDELAKVRMHHARLLLAADSVP